MNIPDIVNKTACLVFLLFLLCFLLRHTSQEGEPHCAAQQNAPTEVEPESRSAEQKAAVGSEAEQASQSARSPIENGAADDPKIEQGSPSLPKQGDTADEKTSQTGEVAACSEQQPPSAQTVEEETRPVEGPVEKEKPTLQTHEESDKPASVEKTEEWDWSVCPSVFGCPCPMMP